MTSSPLPTEVELVSLSDPFQLEEFMSRPVWYRHSLRNSLINPIESVMFSLLLLGKDGGLPEKEEEEGVEEGEELLFLDGDTTDMRGDRFDVLLAMKLAQSFALHEKVEDWGLKLELEEAEKKRCCWKLSTYQPSHYLRMPTEGVNMALALPTAGGPATRKGYRGMENRMEEELLPVAFCQDQCNANLASLVEDHEGSTVLVALGHAMSIMKYAESRHRKTLAEVRIRNDQAKQPGTSEYEDEELQLLASTPTFGRTYQPHASRDELLRWMQAAVAGLQPDVFTWLAEIFEDNYKNTNRRSSSSSSSSSFAKLSQEELQAMCTLAQQARSPVFYQWCLQQPGAELPTIDYLLTSKKNPSVKVLRMLIAQGAVVKAHHFEKIIDKGDRHLGYDMFRICFENSYHAQVKCGNEPPLKWNSLLQWALVTTASADLIKYLFDASRAENEEWLDSLSAEEKNGSENSQQIPRVIESLAPIDVNCELPQDRGTSNYYNSYSYHGASGTPYHDNNSISPSLKQWRQYIFRQDISYATPIELAVMCYGFEHGDGSAVLQVLLDQGADPVKVISHHRKPTALELSISEYKPRALKIMLDHHHRDGGAAVVDPNACIFRDTAGGTTGGGSNNNLKTPLHLAGDYGRADIYDLLIEYGADETKCDYRGYRPERKVGYMGVEYETSTKK